MKMEEKILKLWDMLYKVNKEKEIIEKCFVVWIYNLEIVETDNEYFFNTPKQLISLVNYPNEIYDKEYNDKIQYLLDKWTYKWPIEKHTFKDIYDSCSYIFDTLEKAEEVLLFTKVNNKKRRENQNKIRKLELEIEELKWN